MSLPLTTVIFSKDRALQLDGTLASFNLHCQDVIDTHVAVIYKASSALHQAQYEKVQRQFPRVQFCQEGNFKEQLLSFLTNEHVLFLVDDNIFVANFYIADILRALSQAPDALGCSLRLGRNTSFCYSLNRPQAIPNLVTRLRTGDAPICAYEWPGTEADFNYPLEVSSSVYRCADILRYLQAFPFSHPNSLEALLSGQAPHFVQQKPKLLCYEQSRTFCNPINKVQQIAPNNRAGQSVSHSADDLAELFEKGGRIDVRKYDGYVPNGCHQEVELKTAYSALPAAALDQTPVTVAISEPPLISVVIPCYKQAHFLREAVESVVHQTYATWECFIVNDGSPDTTSSVAQQLIQDFPRCRIALIEKENEGLAEARNTGIRETKGEWLLPLDSDDKFHPTFMQRTLAETAGGSVNIVSTNLQCFGAKHEVLQVFPFSQQQLMQGNVFPYASLYRRALWEKYGGYIPIIPFGAEDYNFWVTCSGELNSRRIADPLFYYRKHEGSSMVDAVIAHQQEVDACLHTCHPTLYHSEVLMRDHLILSSMHDDTMAAINRNIAKFPQYSQPYLWRGLRNEALGHWRQAERDYITSTRLCSREDWQPWFSLTRLYLEQKNYAKAKHAAAETLQKCPNFPARAELEALIALKEKGND